MERGRNSSHGLRHDASNLLKMSTKWPMIAVLSFASSADFMGDFWLWKVAELVRRGHLLHGLDLRLVSSHASVTHNFDAQVSTNGLDGTTTPNVGQFTRRNA